MAWGTRADIPTHLQEGTSPRARPPAEVVELINGAKDPRLGKNVAVSTWVLLVMEGATRGRSEDARKRGSETPRPHRLPAGWSRPAMLGPRPLVHPQASPPRSPPLERKSRMSTEEGHVVLLKAPSAYSRPQAVPGAALSWCPPTPPTPPPAGKERCALLQTLAC